MPRKASPKTAARKTGSAKPRNKSAGEKAAPADLRKWHVWCAVTESDPAGVAHSELRAGMLEEDLYVHVSPEEKLEEVCQRDLGGRFIRITYKERVG